MTLFAGKTALVFGVANEWSLATEIGRALHREGATLGFAHLPGERMAQRVRQATEGLGARFYVPCDLRSDEDIDAALGRARAELAAVDVLIHSVAYAPASALHAVFSRTTRADFQTALDVSTYSLIALARAAEPVLSPGGAIITLSYLGARKVVHGYNVMGVAKAGLECAVRLLAWELGRAKGIRVNGVSAGPVETLAMRGVTGWDRLLADHRAKCPLGRNITPSEVAGAALFLCSPWASAITGEVINVDAGYSIMAWAGDLSPMRSFAATGLASPSAAATTGR